MELVPNDSISFCTRASIPETKAAITITVMVPITTPSIVSMDRNLCCQSVSSPMRRFSRMLLRKKFILLLSADYADYTDLNQQMECHNSFDHPVQLGRLIKKSA